MEHFLNNDDDHNSSFFKPPIADDEPEPAVDMNNISTVSDAKSASPTKGDVEQGESKPKSDVFRPNPNIDEESNIKLQVLVSNFSDEQLDRYETYRRSAFSKVSIKRLMNSITGTVPSSNVVIAMAGIAKVFVGEIVEEALEVQRREKNHDDSKLAPLEPHHLREAHRRINNRYHCPQKRTWKSKRKSRFS